MELANHILEQETLGKGVTWPLTVDDATGDLKTSEDEDNIAECINLILMTRVGERPMNEDFGTRLPRLLFENIEGLVDVVPVEVVTAIRRWEPRVADVYADATVEGTILMVEITWTVRSTGTRKNLTFPFYTESASGGLAA